MIVDSSFGYRILNFAAVFATISLYVNCKTCGSHVKFAEDDIRGLGFKIVIQCNKCGPQRIPSCPQIDKAYEINTRFVFVLRVLGLGQSAMRKFCGLMDLPKPIAQSTYDAIVKKILIAAQTVCDVSLKIAATEEKTATQEAEIFDDETGIVVSGMEPEETWLLFPFRRDDSHWEFDGESCGHSCQIIILQSL